MVQRTSPARKRSLEAFGRHLHDWRKLHGLSASELARRAHVSRDTLRAIEQGSGTTQLDSVLAVASALGIIDTLVAAADPLSTDAGRALALEQAGAR
ncbi:helix-turn-helix domain-containing protein [Leucobacter sp. gxy201]|uniref:helix-turn-helix domain-containing protein n=1 Tax=Leucobacter sp. gxy201 TaxID=2957200 RepID=UPI003DA0D5BB